MANLFAIKIDIFFGFHLVGLKMIFVQKIEFKLVKYDTDDPDRLVSTLLFYCFQFDKLFLPFFVIFVHVSCE